MRLVVLPWNERGSMIEFWIVFHYASWVQAITADYVNKKKTSGQPAVS